jgi:predicted transcriptional regulator
MSDELHRQAMPMDLQAVLEQVFAIKQHDLRTFTQLQRAPGSTVNELAGILDRDRSTVNRSLTTLREQGLVRRERRLLDTGGYVYQYIPADHETVRTQLHEGLDRWCATMHAEIDAFDGSL